MDCLDSASPSTDELSLSQSACTTDVEEVLNDPEIEELMQGITLKANAIGEKQERRNDTQERIEEMWERIREGIREDCEGHKEIREMISEVQERIDKVQESIFEAQEGIKDVQEGISDVLAAIVGDPEAKDRICRKVAIKKRRDSLMQANPSWDSETHFQSKPEGPDRMATEKTLYTVAYDASPTFEQLPSRARARSV